MLPADEAFSSVIFSALCACLNLDPDSAAASALIIPSFQEPEPSIRLARKGNAIYYSVSSSDAQPDRWSAQTISSAPSFSHTPQIASFLSFTLLLICYGPESSSYAHRIRSFLYLDGSGMPRQILRKAGIYPVPDPPQPVLLHEPEGGLWRDRADLSIPLRVLHEQKSPKTRPSLSTPPAIVIRR